MFQSLLEIEGLLEELEREECCWQRAWWGCRGLAWAGVAVRDVVKDVQVTPTGYSDCYRWRQVGEALDGLGWVASGAVKASRYHEIKPF